MRLNLPDQPLQIPRGAIFHTNLLITKVMISFLLVLSLQLNAKSFAQDITLNGNNIPIKEVFESIHRQTGYQFVYNYELLSRSKQISIHARDAPLKAVLEQCFRDQPFTYTLLDSAIILKAPPMRKPLEKEAQTLGPVEVTGLVTDSTGTPLPGVTVVLKSKPSIGTTTDLNGRYVLEIPEEAIQDAKLVFSMVGFDHQEISLNGKNKVDVKLLGSSTQLGETVVVAFGSQLKKEDVVGAVTTVNPAELKIPSSNLTTALAGRAAGIIAFQRTGEPGLDNANFFIRGVTTFGYKVDPLILIDNVEVTPTDLARLQVDDIASFSILKDATATAVYGARGANGVILITTKEGKEGKAKIALRVENSISLPTKDVALADPITYMRMADEAVLTRDPLGFIPYNQKKIENTIAGTHSLLYPTTDWRKQLLKRYTMNQRFNLSVNGGGKVARYYVSGALNQDNGILKVPKRNNFNNNINLKTYSLRSNVNVNLSKTTEMIVRLSGSFDDYSGPIDGGTKVYRDIMRSDPVMFAPYYPAEGAYQYVNHIMFGNFGTGDYLNPYADMVKGYREYSRAMVLAQLELKQDLSFVTEGLSFRVMANTTRNAYFSVTRQYHPFYYQLTGENAVKGGLDYLLLNEDDGTEYLDYNEGTKTVSSVFYMESALNYNRTFHDKHNLSGMLVTMVRSELDGNAGSLQLSLPHRNFGLSGRFTYGYDRRYFAEFNFGYNGSERFYKTHRFGFFPSAGVAWNVSNEKFWEDMKAVVSNLRFRATYGLVGNDAIGSPSDRFFYLSNVDMNSATRGWSFGRDLGNSKDGIDVTRYSNTDITWETAYKTDIAMELELFNKLQITADFFSEIRKNIFMERADIPPTMGLSADISANVGEASGKGVDISANYSQSFYNGLWIQGMANFTYATSKYKVYEEPDYDEYWLTKIGYPISIRRGFIAERLFIDDNEVRNSPEQQFGGEVRGGDIKYMDLNGDGKITNLDKAPLGYPTTPEINYGFGISAGYKGLDFSIFFEGLGRESFWIDPAATAPFRNYAYTGETFPAGTILENQVLKAYANSYWSENHRDVYALWPRLSSANGNANNEQISTWFMRDGTFLRLKELEIGYTLQGRLLEKAHVAKLRVYLNGLNLFTWSKFKLWDIEMASNGLDYPIQKVYNVGVQLSF